MYTEKGQNSTIIYPTVEYNKKNSTEDVSDERAVDAFSAGLRCSDLVEELERTRPKMVSELIEIGSKFANGEDAYNNKRARSPEVDRASRQRHRSRNEDGHVRRNQVAARYERGEEEGNESREYQDKSSRRRDKPKYSNPSAEDMLHGPCRIHYAYLDGKRVSSHLMRDCRTLLRLQDAMESSQGAHQGSVTIDQGYQVQNDTGSKVYISAMIQPIPKSKKEQKSISRQVNLAISSPPATTEYLRWSDQTIRFSRADHPRKVPRLGHAPMELKAQIGGYNVGRVFMDTGSGIDLIYARTLKAMSISLEWLKPTNCSFHGIVLGSANHPLGKIELDVCFGDSGNFDAW
jgi:hypothetical protein